MEGAGMKSSQKQYEISMKLIDVFKKIKKIRLAYAMRSEQQNDFRIAR